MDVLVVGGTGTAGAALVTELAGRGHLVRVLSRSGQASQGVGFTGDLTTGAGLAEAVAGADAVIDVSNIRTMGYKPAVPQLVGGTKRLTAAGHAAGVKHHVLLSIVGVDPVLGGYYRAKVEQEQAVEAGPVPSTILRATQFHDFAGQMIERLRRGPIMPVPRAVMQPVAVSEVATALADAVEAGPAGRLPDLGGPRREQFVDMVRCQLRANGEHTVVIPFGGPGKLLRAMRDGVLLPGPDATLGRQTFGEWLADLS